MEYIREEGFRGDRWGFNNLHNEKDNPSEHHSTDPFETLSQIGVVCALFLLVIVLALLHRVFKYILSPLSFIKYLPIFGELLLLLIHGAMILAFAFACFALGVTSCVTQSIDFVSYGIQLQSLMTHLNISTDTFF